MCVFGLPVAECLCVHTQTHASHIEGPSHANTYIQRGRSVDVRTGEQVCVRAERERAHNAQAAKMMHTCIRMHVHTLTQTQQEDNIRSHEHAQANRHTNISRRCTCTKTSTLRRCMQAHAHTQGIRSMINENGMADGFWLLASCCFHCSSLQHRCGHCKFNVIQSGWVWLCEAMVASTNGVMCTLCA